MVCGVFWLYLKTKVFFAVVFCRRESGHRSSWVDGDKFQTESGYTAGCIWICWHFQLYEVEFVFPDPIDPMPRLPAISWLLIWLLVRPLVILLMDMICLKTLNIQQKTQPMSQKPNPHFGGVFNLQCFSSLVMTWLYLFDWQYQVEKGQVSSSPINKKCVTVFSGCGSATAWKQKWGVSSYIWAFPQDPCGHRIVGTKEGRAGPFGIDMPQSTAPENTFPRYL